MAFVRKRNQNNAGLGFRALLSLPDNFGARAALVLDRVFVGCHENLPALVEAKRPFDGLR